MNQPQDILELEFSVLNFFENFVISRLKEDVVFDRPQVNKLVEVCTDHYGNRKFVYISERIHNYNVNPTVYLQLKEVNYLCGIAIVSQKTSALNIASFEKHFSKIPFEVFLELSEAKKWALEVIKK